MHRVSLKILKEIDRNPSRISELAEKLGKSQSWISTVVSKLEEKNLVEKNRKIKLAKTYEATLMRELLDSYNLEKILVGKKEGILKALLSGAKKPGDLESEGFAKSTVYNALNDLKSAGVLEDTRGGYRISDETLERFLEARKRSEEETPYKANGEKIIIIIDAGGEDGEPTAFSAFSRYGVDYYPNKTYLYRDGKDLEIEDVLIHAVLCAKNKKQMAMCGIFFLRHRNTLDIQKLWKKSEKWNCEKYLANLLAFIDQREVKNPDLFLPVEEFNSLASNYGVHLQEKHSKERLLTGLERIGDNLKNKVDAYLLGGVNLILRGLKDTTKDIDVVLENQKGFRDLVQALNGDNYEEKHEIEQSYKRLEPSAILEKQGSPRWDIFVEVVANCLHLSEEMKSRSEKHTEKNNLRLYLLSPTDIFLFKSVTDREGDLEDAALLARQEEIDWDILLDEIKRQDRLTGRYPSFATLDIIDILKERHNIDPPIRERLASYCLENALILHLEEEPKTIRGLREALDFPEHQIYNKLKKLEKEGRIEVDRAGKLNTYRAKPL
ncbi:hypothetical protein AKJ36_00315 [candidate division MSBL1 archaeon SCGC-AAA259I07]|uniref:Uncharacterized protein n=2 Tax=candidate division MSBL1 TaxID=215777 RepID=A0A133U929_9EURY|nr:hypothetical protein AKJ61_00100 [candidate division MSBL1 archaeon SCGC-AAA259B11]KXA95523.1 hypothetical protein AKJ36_00315 [candidate division MSBL1 archaeon SCGC-AAA259I07]